MSLLEIEGMGLRIADTTILDAVTLGVDAGEILGLVGESGSGKSLTALSVMDLLPRGSRRTGKVSLDGRRLDLLSEADMTRLRGNDIGMVFQEPMTALNPLMTIGDQVAETIRVHTGASRRRARELATRALERVELAPDVVSPHRYPHQMSGGQRQRVGIAMAIALQPRLLIADEPTTALDVTTQAQILDLLARLVREENMALLLITHDLAVVSRYAGQVAVMHDGRVVEHGAVRDVLDKPRHAYTRRLLAAARHVPTRHKQRHDGTLLEAKGLVRDYVLSRRSVFGSPARFRAVDGVDLKIAPGESVGLVGESGSGKSTLARMIVGLDVPQAGSIVIDGRSVRARGRAAILSHRDVQMVFQDPYGSFNPRHRVDRLVAEPLNLLGSDAPRGSARAERITAVLEAVGMGTDAMGKYIHEFSGGQRQRIALARALIVEPALLVLDEAVSALDVSIRAQIIDLLAQISDRLGIAYLFIAHDLALVRAITDRVMVMKDGRIVEEGDTETVLENPKHTYTQRLIAAVPRMDTGAQSNANG